MTRTCLVLLTLIFQLTSSASNHDHQHAHHSTSPEFVENINQWDSRVAFKCALGTGSVFLEHDGLTYSFRDQDDVAQLHDLQQASKVVQEAFRLKGHAWKMQFIGNLNPSMSGQLPKDHYYNYFIGQDESRWASRVKAYEHVMYENLYVGVQMMAYSHEGNFKYDFILEPNSNPDAVNWSYEGLDGVNLENGTLNLSSSIGEFYESRPYAYQLIGDKEVEVECLYKQRSDGSWGFEFPQGYNQEHRLIIDPELIAATLSGTTGFASNYGHSAAFDIEGNIFTGCVASGDEYPVVTGAFQETYGGGQWDVGISKLTPDGTQLIWATLIGGSSAEYPHSMIANNVKELYIYGSTASDNYPTTSGAFQPNFGGEDDIIVTKLSEDGTDLLGSTYLGGSGSDGRNQNSFNYGDTYRGEIILDYDNSPIITSLSSSTDFPVLANAYQSSLSGMQDAVVFKFNENLANLVVSTYFGGTEDDSGYGIRTSVNGEIFIAGGAGENLTTTATAFQPGFAGPAGSTDGFIAKLNSAGSQLLASTYFGTEDADQAFFIDLDFDENVFIFGQNGAELPIVGDVYVDDDATQFVSKFSNDLSTLMISTTVGGSGFNDFVPDAFLVDNCDNIYLSGYNAGNDYALTDDALFDDGGFYLAVFEEDMSEIVFGTYYTGDHVDGGTSRFDKNGIVYQAVCSGGGFSTTDDAWATDQEPGWDIGVFKINFDASGVNAAVAANNISGCAPFEITFENYSVGDQFLWDFGNGESSTEYAPTYIYESPGVYDVSLIASDSLSCNLADTSRFQITISTPQDFAPSFTYELDCENSGVICTNTTGLDFLDYLWDMGDGTQVEAYDLEYQYENAGDYTLSLIAIDNGCDADEEISEDIVIQPFVQASIGSEDLEACEELEATFVNTSENATSFDWVFGDGENSTDESPTHTYTGPAVFEVILMASNPTTCNGSDQDTILITIGANQILNAEFSVLQTDCQQFIVETDNQSTGINCSYSWDMGDGTLLEGFNISHSYAAVDDYEVTLTMTDTLCDINDDYTLPISITDEVLAIIDNGDEVICAPTLLSLGSSSVGDATWDFGDGSPAQDGAVVEHLYDIPGTYTVTLSVEGTSGCLGTDDITSTVEVQAPPTLVPSFEFIPDGPCIEMNYAFDNTSSGPIDEFYWEFDDEATSSEENPSHTFSLPELQTVTLTIWNEVCEVEESITQSLTPEQYLDYELEDALICPEIGEITLDAMVPDAIYDWSTGDDSQTTLVTNPGSFTINVIEDGCWYTETIEVSYVEALDLSRIVSQCKTTSNTLVIPYDNAISYLWENGVEEAFMDIEETGLYNFTVMDVNGCTHSGTIDATIIPSEADIFIPNAFSPNNDGINDYFLPVSSELQEYELVVYDRWGDVIFESNNVSEPWNGGVKGGGSFYVPDGVYTYQITYLSTCSTERKQDHGMITVIR